MKKPETATPLDSAKPAKVKEKAKPVAYVNYAAIGPDGKILLNDRNRPLLRSDGGFRIFDNEHTKRSEKALVALAEREGGTAQINMRLTIVKQEERSDEIDITNIETIPFVAND